MNKKLIPAFISCVFLFSKLCFAQSPASVNPLTGALDVNLPIYTLSKGQVGLPVSLAYSTNGIKPKDVEGTAGMSWNIQAGGQISRQVRDIPDDISYDNSSTITDGWMNTGYSTFISGFSPANDNSYATCSDETADINYINGYLSDTREDTEPDIFYVSAPGLSCQMVYDKINSKFQLITYQDLVISYTTVGGTGHDHSLITSFTITNNQGIKYVFAAPEAVTETTTLGSDGNAAFFTRKYNDYMHGITYYDAWNLVSITDPTGNGIQLNYTTVSARNSTDPVVLHISGSSTASVQYYIKLQVTAQQLSTINTFDINTTVPGLTFNRTTLAAAGQTGQTIITSITGLGRSFQFSYSPVVYSTTGYSRSFLRSFSEPGCSSPINYTFGYSAEVLSGGNYTTALPDSGTKKIDYWGYYTNSTNTSLMPKLWVNPGNSAYPRYAPYYSTTGGGSYTYSTTAGSSRIPMALIQGEGNISIGCLATISYAQGGSTTITYEQNDYLDVPSGQTVVGSGVRVVQLTDYDGISTANNINRNYAYIIPGSANSSGKPISLPAFAFTVPSTTSLTGQSLWDYVTVISENDMSEEDHTIMYAYVRLSQTHAGSSLYQYYVPATYWDSSAAPACSGCTTEWYPTVNDVARNSCTTANWNVKNDIYTYPFTPNPNYSFERGLLQKVIAYNDANFEVSERSYTYQRLSSPSVISAFREDDMNFSPLSIKTYNKYNVYYNTGELTTQVTSKVYDSPTLSYAQTSTVNYTYDNACHMLSQEQATNSDGSVFTTKYTYVKDYPGAAAGTNPYVTALYYLQQPALNMNLPVETYKQVTKGGTTLTTAASLNLYSAFTAGSNTWYLPAQQQQMLQPDGVSNFVSYAVNGTSQTSTPDSRYLAVANFTKYDNYGYPVTADDAHKHVGTALTDHFSNRTVASFSNALSTEVAFSDFDSDPSSAPANSFIISGSGTFTPVGSHAGNAYGLPATTKTVTSPGITKNAATSNYIFSIWINAPTGANTLNVSLNGGTATGYTYTGTGAWTYYEWKVPVGSMPAPPTTFTLSFTSAQNISIDDILFYPDVAQASTATFDATYHYQIAQTNTNGVSAYFTNDQWGRTLYALDQDKNIVQKNTFLTPSDVQSFTAAIVTSGTVYKGVPAAFTVSGPDACSAVGVTVDWTFGDGGSTTGSAGLISPNHTYTTAGNFTVSATVHSPLYGTKVLTPISVTVSIPSVQLSYTSYTLSNGDISSVLFKQGGATVYSFTGSQLNTSTVPQGVYTVVVTLSDGSHYDSGTGAGYNSVDLNGNCGDWCGNWVSSNVYTFTTDLSTCTNLAFTVSQSLCGS